MTVQDFELKCVNVGTYLKVSSSLIQVICVKKYKIFMKI